VPSTERKSARLILFLGFLNALTPFTIDLYLPCFADIAADLGTTVPRVSLSVATYFVGFAIGQILYGPLLDRFGRKPPIYAGLTLYVIASLGCMTAQSVEALLFFRFLSALGGAAASVGTVTMVRDYFAPKEGARVFSMLMLVLSVSPLLAPTIGAWVGEQFGWRTIFGILTVVALCDFFLVAFGLPKVYAPDRSVSLRLWPVVKNFIEVFQVRQFRVFTLAGALSFSGLFVYLTGSPSIYIDGFQVSKQTYGFIFALLAVGMIGGGQLNNFLGRKIPGATIFKRAVLCQVVVALFFLGGLLTFGFGLVSTTALLFVLLACAGIAYPNAAALALEPFSKNVGSASSLLGFLQMGLGAFLASLVGVLDAKGALPTGIVMALSSVLALAVLYWGERGKSRPDPSV
jgi:DHA1 family bicyclomycin/chloramphenicol resistance-like MFS transporter